MKERYEDQPDKRYGLMTSSRDKALGRQAEHNRFDTAWRFQKSQIGPWDADAEEEPMQRACRHLVRSITEFEAQGLGQDGVIVRMGH